MGAAAMGAVAWQWNAPPLAPVVQYTLLDGQARSSQQWNGKVMVVNFWATSCTTCVKEMPALMATHEKFKGPRFDTLAVAMAYDPPDYVAAFAQTRKLPFGVAIDNSGAIANAFDPAVRMTPTTFVIDKQGRIVKRYLGEPDFKAMHQLIETLIAA
ncbi:TlpA family protein disulfide reductase [Inhella sp. 4Y17]|uniref:TlpA family protein disulfide reductase n=2 Tax=Inhella gelatinilytica TaxID=2795030 RepID=A0A931NEP0_9BURK|nr:TlpA family protein disulfide reductase [Inhella gelatinilytica]